MLQIHDKSSPVGPRDMLPGWGTVDNPEEWEAIDRLNEQEEAEALTGLLKSS